MGLRAKLIFGLVIFFVIFGLRFLCANCEEIGSVQPTLGTINQTTTVATNAEKKADLDNLKLNSSGSNVQNRQPRARIDSPFISLPLMDSMTSDSQIYQQEVHLSSTQEPSGRRRRLGTRKRKRRPQIFTTESSDPHHWRGQVEDDRSSLRRQPDQFAVGFSSDSSAIGNEKPFSTISSVWQERRDSLPTSSASVSSSIKISERVREPLLALEKEQKLSELREKQRKEYAAIKVNNNRDSSHDSNPIIRDKSYRKPFSQAKREEIALSTMTSINRYTSPSPPVASTSTISRTGSELKNILKNSGGLSLSEILQQKNLSLEDLLKGKQNALLALQNPTLSLSSSSSSSSSQSNSKEEVIRPFKPVRRIPISYLTSPSPPSIMESGDFKPPRKMATNLLKFNRSPIIIPTIKQKPYHMPINHKPETTSIKSIQTNEITSESNIELISNSKKPNLSINLYDKPTNRPIDSLLINNFGSNLEILSYSDDTTDNRDDLAIKSKIINDANREIEKEAIYQVGSFNMFPIVDHDHNLNATPDDKSIDNRQNHDDSIEEKLKYVKPETNLIEKFDESEKIDDSSDNIDNVTDKSNDESQFDTITSRIDYVDGSNTFENKKPIKDVTERNPSLFADITSDRTVDDRTDLLELMEDRRSGSRLFKVLAQRNMTLEELIEHRKRGSSTLHLSEIISNKTKTTFPFVSSPDSQNFPSTPEIFNQKSIIPQLSIADDKLDIVTAFENFPHFDLTNLKSIKPDEIKLDSQGASYFTSIIDIKPTDEIYKEGRSIKSLDLPQTQENPTPPPLSIDVDVKPFPHWKSLGMPASYSSQESNYIDQPGPDIVASSHIASHHISDIEDLVDPVLQIEDEVARAHDLLDLELSGHGLKRNAISIETAHIPMGVRSAIIASSAIVGFSLIIFLIIFITCRWRQRRSKKLTYTDHYNAIKGRLPVISRQSSTISNIGTRLGTISGSIKRSSTSSPSIFPDGKSHKLNTMDPNSPEVQEYLFDAMRKPFQ